MATISTEGTYSLSNSYKGMSYLLAVSEKDTSTLVMTRYSPGHDVPASAQWFATVAEDPPYYRLHTASGGSGLSLDVLNENGTSSVSLHMTGTGNWAGQRWRFDTWPDDSYPFRLSNSYTGLGAHLDVYSDTLEAHLAQGEATGQYWAWNPVPVSIPGSTSASPTAQPTHPTTSDSTAPPAGTAILSTGAIAGISVGGAVAAALLVGLLLFFMRRRSRLGARSTHAPHDHYYELQDETGWGPRWEKDGLGLEISSPAPVYTMGQRGYHGSAGESGLSTPGTTRSPAELDSPAMCAELDGSR